MSIIKLDRKEAFLQCNTLTIVPHLLKNKTTILDLRNETSVAGIIDDVDGYMNVTMRKAIFLDQRNSQHSFHSYFVPARTIRYIHIPESINVQSAINDFLVKLKAKPTRTKKPFSHKNKGAQARHKETLKELASTKTN